MRPALRANSSTDLFTILTILCISAAVLPDSSANFLTSSATTENPLPASPARAASMAAFKARRFV